MKSADAVRDSFRKGRLMPRGSELAKTAGLFEPDDLPGSLFRTVALLSVDRSDDGAVFTEIMLYASGVATLPEYPEYWRRRGHVLEDYLCDNELCLMLDAETC